MEEKQKRTRTYIILGGVMSVLFLMGLALFSSEAVPVQAASQKSEIEKEIASQLTGKNIVKKICYADYDKNGREEAFVLTGPKKAGKLRDAAYTLWFAYHQDGTVIAKKMRKDVSVDSKMLSLKSVTLFCAASYCATSVPTDVYQVTGNDVKVIFCGNIISSTGGDSFSSVDSTYDFMYDSDLKTTLGHTWKPYYFYYENGKVKEYKGKKITLHKFKKYKNAGKMLKKYKMQGKIKSIIYRSNGIVHVNYKSKSKVEDDGYYSIAYTNVTFRVSGNKLIKPVMDEGTYRKNLK